MPSKILLLLITYILHKSRNLWLYMKTFSKRKVCFLFHWIQHVKVVRWQKSNIGPSNFAEKDINYLEAKRMFCLR